MTNGFNMTTLLKNVNFFQKDFYLLTCCICEVLNALSFNTSTDFPLISCGIKTGTWDKAWSHNYGYTFLNQINGSLWNLMFMWSLHSYRKRMILTTQQDRSSVLYKCSFCPIVQITFRHIEKVKFSFIND